MLGLPSFTAVALPGIPLVQPGDNLAQLILAALERAEMPLQAGDVLVISSKIVSKSERRFVRLADIVPGATAQQLAAETHKDPRLVELVLQESRSISRKTKGVLVVEHRLGFISAMAGIDQSNVDETHEKALLLPLDPDASARQIRAELQEKTGIAAAIVISDTHGRPFRMGNVGVAIGVAGMQAVTDLRGTPDLFGRKLEITTQGYADMVASTAHLLCGEAGEGRPVILLRGLELPEGDGHAADINRPAHLDLYR
jgi:coenzyme F420-0:L-glutamate ligase/coenzyme F420-1:gamma-L-glutamate ligase